MQSAVVSLAVQQAEVRYNAGTVAGAGGSGVSIERQLVAAVENCGFEASGKWAGKLGAAQEAACELLLEHGPGCLQQQLPCTGGILPLGSCLPR